jgi:uncharacterized protein YlaI
MQCNKCGKLMTKRNYQRMFDRNKSIYQYMCSGFPRCKHRVYVDAQNNVISKNQTLHGE